MTTDYNLISELYKKAKEQPWRTAVETYSLMGLVGDLAGKSVVDVACGEGYFTRKLRRAGAAKVLGFDISERMIELARLRRSGFRDFAVHAPRLAPEAEAADGYEYWKDFLERPVAVLMDCVKM